MYKRTYKFLDTTGHIPGIAGEWYAGQVVDVDEDTNTVLAVYPTVLPSPPPREEKPTVEKREK